MLATNYLATKSNIQDMSDHRLIAMYGRVSTREQAEYGYSVLDQEDKMNKYLDYIDEKGETKNRRAYLDKGESAKDLNRTYMLDLIDDIRKNRVKAVVIHNLDRLTRRMTDFIFLIELFEKHDVELISLREKIETNSAMGRFLVFIIILIAEWEREAISERTIRGIDRSAMEGNYTFGRGKIPLGYKREEKKLLIDYEVKHIIELIFTEIASGKHTASSLARYMEMNYPTDTFKWTEDKVSKIIRNEIYSGVFVNKRIRVEEHSPSIVKRELFELANSQMDKRASDNKYVYTFKNRVICMRCNSSMIAEPGTSKTKKIYFYYRCHHCGARVSEINLEDKLKHELGLYARKLERETISQRHLRKIKELQQNKKEIKTKNKRETDDIILKAQYEEKVMQIEENMNEELKTIGTMWEGLEQSKKIEILNNQNLAVLYFQYEKEFYLVTK